MSSSACARIPVQAAWDFQRRLQPFDERPPAVEDRVSAASSDATFYLNEAFDPQDWETEPDPAALGRVREALARVPQVVRDRLPGELHSILVARSHGAFGGLTFRLATPQNRGKSLIVLNMALVRRNGNETVTGCVRTRAYLRAGQSVQGFIEDEAGDDRVGGVYWILLHEVGHVIQNTLTPEAYARYRAISWKDYGNGVRRPRHVANMAGAWLDVVLTRSSFVSPYSTQAPEEDFAEAFASYAHVVLGGRQHSYLLTSGGLPVSAINIDWNSKRLRKKRRFFDQLFGRIERPPVNSARPKANSL